MVYIFLGGIPQDLAIYSTPESSLQSRILIINQSYNRLVLPTNTVPLTAYHHFYKLLHTFFFPLLTFLLFLIFHLSFQLLFNKTLFKFFSFSGFFIFITNFIPLISFFFHIIHTSSIQPVTSLSSLLSFSEVLWTFFL